jgi:hypothetical protein
MDLTEENKKHIDSLSYEALLAHWRFAKAGDPWFQGETGGYWSTRMKELREMPGGDERHTAASKSIEW